MTAEPIHFEIFPNLFEALAFYDNFGLLIEKISTMNPNRYKFYLTGKYEKYNETITPELKFLNERFEEAEEEIYIYEQLNRYMCYINQLEVHVDRPKPWLKSHADFYIECYSNYKVSFDMIEQTSTGLNFLGIDVLLMPVPYTNEMIIPKELYFLSTFSHQYIINTFGMTYHNNQTYLVLMKYNYTLEQAIYAKKFKSKEKHILMLQITTVVWYLQSKKVFGLCLSPSNIVFDCSSENEIKLYQFSYAEIFDNTLKPLNISRDSIYSPPDQFLDEKNEIYSLGMIFYFLYTDGNFDITNDNTSTDDFFYFIKKMISSSMDTRPNIKEVYEFLKQIEKNLND